MRAPALHPPRAGIWASAVSLPLLGFAGVALMVAMPILAHPYLPLVDLPNHIARHHVAVALDGPLARYYSYHVSLVPNSAADLAFMLFGDPANPLRFAQLTMAIYAVSLVGSAMLLSRVVWGRWSVWPLASALVAYNGNFFWGFQNFLLTMPLAIAALALWLGTESRPAWQRLLVMIPAAALIYLMHFFAFSFLALAALGREVQRLVAAGPHRGAQLRRGLPMALPFVLPSVWLVTEMLISPPAPGGSYTAFGDLIERAGVVGSATMGPMVASIPAAFVGGGLALVFLLMCFARLASKGGARLVLASPMVGPALAVILGTLLAPSWLNGVAFVHIRFPFALCVLLIAGSRWEGLTARSAATLSVVVLALIGLRSAAFERSAAIHSAEMSELSATLAALPAGARLLSLYEGKTMEAHLRHVDAYAVSQRDAFIPTLFQGVHNFQVLPEWRPHSHASTGIQPLALAYANGPRVRNLRGLPPVEFVQDWETTFTHVLVVQESAGPSPALPDLAPVSHSGRFTLYSVRPEQE